ncbi:MAG TPA: glycosyltransferase [Chitinophagales bacterium]|nr:glycosyltransferase [Chitinophagales bacterium]
MPRIIFTVINDLTYDHRMHRICNSLVNDGHDVLLVGRKLSRRDPFGKSSVPLQEEEFHQHRLKLIFSRGKLFYIENNIRLFFFLLFQKFDIVCGIDLDTILPCYFISKIKNKKCVYDAHELFPEVPEVIRRPSVQKMWRRVEKFSVSRIKNCYTVSHGLADYFEKNYGRKFEVIRNMPLKDDNTVKRVADSSFRTIIYQGALNEGRGLEAMIEAMQQLDCKLILAGEGDLSSTLRTKVEQLNLSEKIIFAGKKKADELRNLTKQSFIGINLLENKGLNYYYSLANKFFDYVNAGIPQITMNFPEYKMMNTEFEVAALIDDLKTETLLSAIHRLMDEKDFYFRLRENCLRAREVWNWQNEEQKLLAFYRQLK